MKKAPTFFPQAVREAIRANRRVARGYIDRAAWWKERSFDELCSFVFPPTLKRSWFVLSYGDCPSCRRSVPMYDWIINPFSDPWKVKCPHCSDLFPKNDFAAFYRSGLDEKFVFDDARADRSLLVNPHGGCDGVDDGSGSMGEDGERRLFIAAYLIYGQWEQLIIDGIDALSFAHLLSADPDYARRAAVMLYRISRFFPRFDFMKQGVMYEQEQRSNGYVTYWAQSNHDIRSMAIAYDMIFEVLQDDSMLEEYFGRRCCELCSSIERDILQDSLDNRHKYEANPPETDLTQIVVESVLFWPESSQEIHGRVENVIKLCTAVDGLVGEKGIGGYASIGPRRLADLLLLFGNIEDGFLAAMFERYPVLRRTYRFHIDTWYRGRYYPGVGDDGTFGAPTPVYAATLRARVQGLPYLRSMEWFTLTLSEVFDDPAFAQALYITNGYTAAGCFENDLYVSDPETYRNRLRRIIEAHGVELNQTTENFPEWRLALLYSGAGRDRRLLCINYDSGANHAHQDALNIGLFAKGLNLMPDFGYPPVHRGGWSSKRFFWYRRPPSHNVVVIDGKDHTNLPKGSFLRYPRYGAAKLYGEGTFVQSVRADAKEYAAADRYERICALVDIDEAESYCVDLFRVTGGVDHTMFFRSSVAELSAPTLRPTPGGEYGHDTFMRDFRTDSDPPTRWFADFAVHDIYGVLEQDRDIHLRYHSLTDDVRVSLCESWVDIMRLRTDYPDPGVREVWIPTLMIRRKGPESSFLSIIEPFEDNPVLTSVRRLTCAGCCGAALEVDAARGFTDLILLRDPASDDALVLEDGTVETDALLAVVRHDGRRVIETALHGGSCLRFHGERVR